MSSGEHLLCQLVLMERGTPVLQLLMCYKMSHLCSLKLLCYIERQPFPHSLSQANTSTSQELHAMPDVLQSQAKCERLQFTFELAMFHSLTKVNTALYLILFFTFPQIAHAKYLVFLVPFFYISEQKCLF